MAVELESGLAVLSRLCTRPDINKCLGSSLGPLEKDLLMVRIHENISEENDSSEVVTSYLVDLLCNIILPSKMGEREIGGCGAGVVLLDCDHHVKIKMVASALQNRVRFIAEQYYKELKKKVGVTKDELERKRINSNLQWEIVKSSLERLLIMDIYSPENLEVSLLSLHDVIMSNISISAVIINGINSFFHKVHLESRVSHNIYISMLLNIASSVNKELKNVVTWFYVEHDFFSEKKDDNSKHKNNSIVISKSEKHFCVIFNGNKSSFCLNDSGQVIWRENFSTSNCDM